MARRAASRNGDGKSCSNWFLHSGQSRTRRQSWPGAGSGMGIGLVLMDGGAAPLPVPSSGVGTAQGPGTRQTGLLARWQPASCQNIRGDVDS